MKSARSQIFKFYLDFNMNYFLRWNIAKGTTDPRVEFLLQVVTQILIELHLQNLEQVSFSKSQPNMNISIKVKLPNIDQT